MTCGWEAGLSVCSEDSSQTGFFPLTQGLDVSHVPQEKGYTFQTRGLLIFPPKVTRGIQRSSPGRGHVCGTKPRLFPEAWIVLMPPQLCLLCWECFLNCSIQTPILATQSPGFVCRPKSRNELPLQRVVGSRWLCRKQMGEGKGGAPRLLFLHISLSKTNGIETIKRASSHNPTPSREALHGYPFIQ